MPRNQPIPTPDTPFWRWLAHQQEAQHMNLRQIALRAGMSGNTLYQIRSRNGRPDAASCRKLAATLGADEDYVLALAGFRTAVQPAHDLRQVLRDLYPNASPQQIGQALRVLRCLLEADESGTPEEQTGG